MCMIKQGYELRRKKGLRSTAKSSTDSTKTIDNSTTTITIKQQKHQQLHQLTTIKKPTPTTKEKLIIVITRVLQQQ